MVTLPRVSERCEATAIGDAANVLIVDDEVAIRQVFSRVLGEQGYRTETAGDAQSALALIEEIPFAVIISDIRMPGMSGIELARELRARKVDVPVVLVTGNPGLETAIEAMEHGIVRYLRKPVEPRALARVTRETIRLHDLARAEQLAIDNASLRALVDELVRARDAAKAASRAKSGFLAMMSHELRSPIAAILGYADLVLDGEIAGDDRVSVSQVRASAESLLATVGNLLNVAELVRGESRSETTSFDARRLVAERVERFESAALAKGLLLRLDVGPEVPELVGDAPKFGELLEHILRNAIKFTGMGEVVVKLSVIPKDARGAELHVSVADTGVGIPAEERARVREAFAQADDSSSRRFGGAGLGLAISCGLVRLLGGTLEIDSALGRGTTVHVMAPFGLRRAS